MLAPQREFIRDYHETWWDSLDAGWDLLPAHLNASRTAHSLCTSSIGPVLLQYRLQYELSAMRRCAPPGVEPDRHIQRVLTQVWNLYAEPAASEAVKTLKDSDHGPVESSGWAWHWTTCHTMDCAEIFKLDEVSPLTTLLSSRIGEQICAALGAAPQDVVDWSADKSLPYDAARPDWLWHYSRWSAAYLAERTKSRAGPRADRVLAARLAAVGQGLYMDLRRPTGDAVGARFTLTLRSNREVAFEGTLAEVEAHLGISEEAGS